jgi:hypothetical protein
LVTKVAAVAFGNPDTESATFPENPFRGLIETVITVASVGYNGPLEVADNEKSGVGALTTNIACTQVVWPPFTPLIANGYDPTGTDPATDNVNVELVPEVEVGFGLNAAVTPAGRSLFVLNVIAPENPDSLVADTT